MACAPSRSDCMPNRFRSRQEYWSTVSIHARCWMSTASDSALMRAPRGPSGMWTTSTPRIFNIRACSTMSSLTNPFGGISSMMVLKRPSASDRASCERSFSGTSARLRRRVERARRRLRLGRRCLAGRDTLARGRSTALARVTASLDLPDVLRRGAAAAADQPHAARDEPPRVRRHVLGRREVDVAPLDVARTAGIGLRGQPRVADRGNALDRFEHRRRSDAAVHADDVGALLLERRRELLGRRAVKAVAILLGRHLRHDRQVADARARRQSRRSPH